MTDWFSASAARNVFFVYTAAFFYTVAHLRAAA
jgi:hypothetical protein